MIIKLGISHLNSCFDLDQIALNGLWSKGQWEKELTEPNRICIGLIKPEKQKLLGVCTAWSVIDELHITSIAVHPLHQRKGLGKILILDLIKRSRSLLSNQLRLEVKSSNEPAKAFYKSMGFKIVGNRLNIYRDGSDAILFKKQLNKNPERTIEYGLPKTKNKLIT